MLYNNLRTALRSLKHHHVYSSINIVGLTVGLWACMIVATVVIDDLSYDKQWSRSKDLYRIVSVNKMGEGLYDRSASSFAGLTPELKKNFPEVASYAQFSVGDLRLKLNEADENGMVVPSLITDTSFWQMLDVQVVSGNPRNYVDGQSNIVISESTRNKYFTGQDPVGKIVYDVPSYQSKPTPYLITGVIKDLPANTHLRADIIKVNKRRVEELNKNQYGTFTQDYVLLKPGSDVNKLTSKVNDWYKRFVTAEKPYQYEFQPITDVYLHADFAQYQKVKGSIQNIYIFSGVALLLLLIACVNFINLSTARAATRLRETGVRKILGAAKKQIVYQFLAEAMLFFVISSVLALLLYQLSLTPVENYLCHTLQQTIFSNVLLFAAAVGIILVVSVFTGIYPAFLMSGFKPSNAIKGRLFTNQAHGQNYLRKSLVVLQFCISIGVLVAMIVVQQQLKYIDSADIGYNKKNLLNIAGISWDGKGEAFKNELMRMPGVVSASRSTWTPSSGAGFMSREIDDPNNKGNKLTAWYISGDADLAQTLGFKLKNGRLLSADLSFDTMNEDSMMGLNKEQYEHVAQTRTCVITAATSKLLHVKKLNQPLNEIKAVPVGVIEDFHNQSFHEILGPTIILAERSPEYSGMLIRVAPGAEQQVAASLQQLWRQFYPGKLLDTGWIEDMLAKQYEAENKIKQLFTFFSMLTMALAALGIFGLVVQAAQQRVKEIGVRKVLGASVSSVTRLLSFGFIKLVLLSAIVVTPVAWYVLNKWLQDFAYRIQISWWMFAVAGFIALVIALITVSFQAVKAALANPVKSLRSE